MTIVEAAKRILSEAAKPMSARELVAEIENRRLFRFGAKDPVSVLGSALRRYCAGSKTLGDRRPTFVRVEGGLFTVSR